MNKKILAVAVAATFLAPDAALAQSSVTISGFIRASFGQYSVGGRAAGSTGSNDELQVRDESSRIIFQVREDLGGGLAAIGKFDLRFGTSDGGVGGNSGESYVGLTSPKWGTIGFGKYDFHYGNSGSFTGTHLGLQTNPTSIMDVAGQGGATIANQTRTNNAIRYGSPKWADMFEVVVGYSTNPTAASAAPAIAATNAVTATPAATAANQNENDLRSTARKGSAWNIVPKIWGKNWEAAYSYWQAKPDIGLPALAVSTAGALSVTAVPATVVKHRGDSLYGWYKWGGLRVGLAYNKSKVDTTTLATGTTLQTSDRTAWGIPVSYTMGNHNFYMDYNQANGDDAAQANFLSAAQIAAGTTDTKARMFGLAYGYDLSKRTSVGVSYTEIKNGNAARYNLFAGNAGLLAGEDPKSFHVTMTHRY